MYCLNYEDKSDLQCRPRASDVGSASVELLTGMPSTDLLSDHVCFAAAIGTSFRSEAFAFGDWL